MARVPSQLPAGPRPEGPLLISVYGGKGGIGKTVASEILASGLGRIGPTLGVDGDMRQTDANLSELHRLAASRGEPTYQLLAIEDPREYGQLRKLRQFRYIVIDNAPHRDAQKLRAAAASADLVVVPLVPRTQETKGAMSGIREILTPLDVNFRVLVNAVTVDRRTAAANMLQTLSALGMPHYRSMVRWYVAHQDAANNGPALLDGDGPNWDKARSDAYDFIDETLEVLGESHRIPRRQGQTEKIGTTK